VEKQ
jgi:hypothetical protein